MKFFLKNTIFFIALAISQNVFGSVVNISNKTIFKIKASLDVVMYPDPQKDISSNTSISENIGAFFMRGVTIGIHIGDQFIENILSESHSQTLGFGDIYYNIFSEVKNLGRGKFIDEYVLEFTFYLVRSPKFIYSGGIMNISEPIIVSTRGLETFKVVGKDYINSCNQNLGSTANVCVTGYNVPNTAQNINQNCCQQPTQNNTQSVTYGGTAVR